MEAQTAPIAQYHDEEAWLRERKKHLTASEIAAIFGDHPFKTAAMVQADKLSPEIDQELPGNQAEAGRDLEPIAARKYAAKTGRRIRRMPMIVHRDRPLFASSIDRQILAGPDNPTAALELKSPTWKVFSEIRRQGLRKYMIYQGQMEAECGGYPFTAFGIFSRERWEILDFDLVHEVAFCQDVMDRGEEWWHRHIINREPVEVAEPPENLPEVEGEILTREDEPFLEAVDMLLELRDVKKEAEEAYAAAKTQLKATLGAFGAYEGGGARVYYGQRAGRLSKDWKALERAQPWDPALLQAALCRTLTNFPGIEDHDVLSILEQVADEVRLDLAAFQKQGSPYEELRPYRIKNVEV